MAEIILAIAALVLQIAGVAVPEVHAVIAQPIKQELGKIARELYTRIQQGQLDIEKLYQAYTTKNTAKLNSMMLSPGFSPSYHSLKKEIESDEKKYNDERKKLQDEVTENTNQYNRAVEAGNFAGTTIQGTVSAQETLDDLKRKKDNTEDQLQQSINGGVSK